MSLLNPFSLNSTPTTKISSSLFAGHNNNNNNTLGIFQNSGIANNENLFQITNNKNALNNNNFLLTKNFGNIDNNESLLFLNHNQNIIQNQHLDLNNPKIIQDISEYREVLLNIEKYSNIYLFNLLKDYIFMHIPEGKSSNNYNQYRPFLGKANEIISGSEICEEITENDKNPNSFFPNQINSFNTLLDKFKNFEKRIFINIANTLDNVKNLEKLDKKIDYEMNNNLSDLKNCFLKINILEINLSSKIAQYNYLVGEAKENVVNTQEIKDNIKKANDNIDKNNMADICKKIKKYSNENFMWQNKNYIKDMNKERINEMLDSLLEIKNVMNFIYDNNKKNLDIIIGMNKQSEKIFK